MSDSESTAPDSEGRAPARIIVSGSKEDIQRLRDAIARGDLAKFGITGMSEVTDEMKEAAGKAWAAHEAQRQSPSSDGPECPSR